jgi:hypothetical protein
VISLSTTDQNIEDWQLSAALSVVDPMIFTDPDPRIRSKFGSGSTTLLLIHSLILIFREAAVIHWSSGTSGTPKGIVHCQEYLHYMLR